MVDKHHCKYCNCWVQGDKVSIRNHEGGNRHKFAMQNFFKTKREEKETASRDQNDMAKQMRDIEKAAQARFAQDMQGESSVSYEALAASAAAPIGGIGPTLPPRNRLARNGTNASMSTSVLPPPPPSRSDAINVATTTPPPPPPRSQKGDVKARSPSPPPPPPRERKRVEALDETSEFIHSQASLRASCHAEATDHSASSPLPSLSPPPPPRPSRPSANLQFAQDTSFVDAKESLVQQGQEDKGQVGIYSVRGVTYLEGKHFENKLYSGIVCQVWMEEFDSWVDSTIYSVSEISIPNTDRVVRKYVVCCALPGQEEIYSYIQDISSDRIRICLTNGMPADYIPNKPMASHMHDDQEASPVVEPQPSYQPINEHTGLGGWSTVSVQVVTSDAKKATLPLPQKKSSPPASSMASSTARAPRPLAFTHKQPLLTSTKEKTLDMSMEEAGDDALGAYNPFSTQNSYKGFTITDNTTTTHSTSASTTSASASPSSFMASPRNNVAFVAFKKRPKKAAADHTYGTQTGTGNNNNDDGGDGDGHPPNPSVKKPSHKRLRRSAFD